MAFKKYAYYNKGNKVAIVESSVTSSGGTLAIAHCTISGYTTKDTCEAAGGQWIPSSGGSFSSYEKYTSPSSSISKGIEIEYSYAPVYNLQSTGTEGSDFHRFLGWGSNGVNLVLFIFSGASTAVDLSSLFSADDWIYIEGSGRWSGLHQVKSAGGSTGILTLKTRCNLKPSAITVTGTFEADDETFIGDNAAHIMDIEAFKDAQNTRGTAYVFVDNTAHGSNHGVFSLSSDTTSGRITFANKYSIDADGDYTETAAASVDGGADEVTIYNVFYEEISVYEGVEVMEDETFELDLPRYQANAIAFYLKAKVAEEIGDIERVEYFMRLWKKAVEKGRGARKRGPYIAQSFWGMRNY